MILRPIFDSYSQPLPESTRSYFEPRFGCDLSRVRLHTNARGADPTQALDAQAYTTRRDIAIGAGWYAAETTDGKHLLAHELMHGLQQGSTSESHLIQRQDIRLPVFEETVTQISTVETSIHARSFRPREEALAHPVFGESVDCSRVRLIVSCSMNSLCYTGCAHTGNKRGNKRGTVHFSMSCP